MRLRTGKVNVPILVIGLTTVIALVALLFSGFGKDPTAVPDELTGKSAPTFTLQDLEGNEFSLASLQGKPVLLNFWSTWCGPCKYEHPLLQRAADAYPDVQFLGVIYSDDPIKVARYLEKAGASYPSLVDPGNRMAIAYGVAGVPESFFIDKSGQIAFKKVGPLNGPEIESWLNKLVTQ